MKEKEIERLTKLKEIEKDLYGKGFKNICGIDEAGRGPLAGPVVVAGVIMPPDSMIEGVNDSKKVSEKKREKLYDLIISCPNSNYLQYHQDGRLNGVVPYFIKNFNDIKLLIDDLKDLDNNIEEVFNHR